MIFQYNGLISYQQGLNLQQQSFELVKTNTRPVLLGCEHYPVITLGRRATGAQEFLSSESELKERGLEIFATDRGGQATLHSPGQLVIYPIVPIRHYGIGVRDFIHCLQQTTVTWLSLRGISAHQREEDPGVYTEQGKIGFVGLRVQQGITRHGLSLNISNNLDLFQWIRACGQSQRALDSLERHGQVIDPAVAFEQWSAVFTSELIGLREQTRH